jgi:hypothetical protein
LILVASFLAAAACTSAAELPPPRDPLWDVEVGGGLLLFSPDVERIPRGSSETAVDGLVELSMGRRISRRLEIRLEATYAAGSDSEWESESDAGTAVIPTPSVVGGFGILEAPLFVGRGPIVPHAGIGAGFLVFGEIDEDILFDWGTYETTNRIRFAGRTDPALLFDMGARVPLSPRLWLVLRYRLLTAFDDEQVNTLDRVTLSSRIRW